MSRGVSTFGRRYSCLFSSKGKLVKMAIDNGSKGCILYRMIASSCLALLIVDYDYGMSLRKRWLFGTRCRMAA